MLYLLFLSLGIFAKQLDLSAQFNELDSWKYLTKFAVGVGNANWELNITVADPDTSSTEKIKLSLIIYLDDQLEEIASIDDCPRKIASAKKVQNFTVPLAGESTNIKGTFTQKTRPHVWYYALADCKGTSKGHKLLVDIHLTGTDDSEFSIEEEGFIYLYPAVAIIFLISLSQNLLRMIQKFRKEDKFEPVSLFLNLAIFCDFAGIICKIIHLWIYSINGRGLFILNFLNQALGMASSLIVTIMFIVIAKGWLIKYKHMPKAELVIPIALVVLIANTLILAYGSLTDDLHNKFSDYEGTAGIALILLRICLLLWFLYHIRDLYKSAKTSQLNFVISFGFIAMAYFLALPLLVTSSLIFKNYLRTKLVSIGSAIIQIIVFFFLTHLFSETSSFYKISTLSHSVLPGKNN